MIEGTIYFLKAPEIERIKIGYSRKALHLRIRRLDWDSPVDLELFGIIEVEDFEMSVEDFETQLHSRFHERRIHGEWFIYDEGFLVEITNIPGFTPARKVKIPQMNRQGPRLSPATVLEIDKLLREKQGVNRPYGYIADISRKFGVTIPTISFIEEGRTWSHMTGRKRTSSYGSRK